MSDSDSDDDDDTDERQQEKKQQHDTKRNWLFVGIFAGVLMLIGAGLLIYHLAVGRHYVATTDAYVNGDLVQLAPQVSGTVAEITTDQTQAVRRGQLLVRLDPHDAYLSLAQAKANLAQTVREVVQLFAQETRDEANIMAQEAQVTLAH